MGLLSSSVIASIRSTMGKIKDDNPTSITIRRNGTDLGPFTVRVASKQTQNRVADSGELQASLTAVTILGDLDLDIQPQDRFTSGGNVYEVMSVAPNRLMGTLVQAVVIQ